MKRYGSRAILNSGWRRRAGYDAALILSDRKDPKPLPVIPEERKEWKPVIRVSETVMRRRAQA